MGVPKVTVTKITKTKTFAWLFLACFSMRDSVGVVSDGLDSLSPREILSQQSRKARPIDGTIVRMIEQFVDGAVDLKESPRILFLDMDGVLIDEIGEKLDPELAQLIIGLREEGVHIGIASGAGLKRIKQNIISVLKVFGSGRRIRVYSNGGAMGFVYRPNWDRDGLYEVSFHTFKQRRKVQRNKLHWVLRDEILSQGEYQQLVETIDEVVGKGHLVWRRPNQFVIHLGDFSAVVEIVPRLSEAIERLGINDRLRKNPILSAYGIGIKVRGNRTGYADVVIATKEFALRHGVHVVQKATRGKVVAKHVMIIEDSLARPIGTRILLNGMDIARAKIQGEYPHVLNVGGLGPNEEVDNHVLTYPAVGKKATQAFLRLLLETIREAKGSLAESPQILSAL